MDCVKCGKKLSKDEYYMHKGCQDMVRAEKVTKDMNKLDEEPRKGNLVEKLNIKYYKLFH